MKETAKEAFEDLKKVIDLADKYLEKLVQYP